MKGTDEIIGRRWCQNHDHAQSKAEGIVMVLTSPRAYNFKLCPELKAVNICFIYQMKGTKLIGLVCDCAPAAHSYFIGHNQNYARSFN